MAKIRLRFGENEVEIESRDFYIDNNSANEVITELARNLGDTTARVITDDEDLLGPPHEIKHTYKKNLDYLKLLRDVEFHEPEFSAPTQVSAEELPSKIAHLESDAFFAKPRTVSETVEQLRDHGWVASPLDVSKALAKMALHRELAKNSQENKIYYQQMIS